MTVQEWHFKRETSSKSPKLKEKWQPWKPNFLQKEIIQAVFEIYGNYDVFRYVEMSILVTIKLSFIPVFKKNTQQEYA